MHSKFHVTPCRLTVTLAAFGAWSVAVAAGPAPVDAMSVARAAIADGLPDRVLDAAGSVARAGTNAAERAEARCLVLDALSRKGDWKRMLAALDGWPEEKDERFRYRRALAEAGLGKVTEARRLLEAPFGDSDLRRRARPFALFLEARASVMRGDRRQAERLLETALRERTATLSNGVDAVAGKLPPVGADAVLDELVFYASELKASDGTTDAVLTNLAARAMRPEIRFRAEIRLGLDELKDPWAFSNGVVRLRAAVTARPSAPEALPASLALASEFLRRDAVAAEAEYARIAEAYPETSSDPRVLESWAGALSAANRKAEAVAMFVRAERAATNDAVRAQCILQRAETLRDGARFADAAKAYGEAAAIAGPHVDNARFAAADALLRAGEDKAAETSFSEIAAGKGPWRLQAKLRLAALAAASGRSRQAVADYASVLEDASATVDERVKAYEGRARTHYRAFHFKEAAADFAAAAKLDPALREKAAFFNLLCLYGEGRDTAARAAAVELAATARDQALRADVCLWLARFDYYRKEWTQAESNFNASAELRQDKLSAARAQLWAARAALNGNAFERAVGKVAEALRQLRQVPEHEEAALRAEAHTVQGEALMESGQFVAAAAAFSGVLLHAKEGEVRRHALERRADAIFATGADNATRYREALEAFRALLADAELSENRRIAVAFKIGRALEKMHRPDEAERQYYEGVILPFDRALKRGGSFDADARAAFARAAFACADLCEDRGDPQSAVGVLQRVVASGVASAPEAARRIEQLEAGGYRRPRKGN